MALVTESQQDAAAAGDGAKAKRRFTIFDDEDYGQAYWIYWCACFATVITWVFAVSAAADDGWINFYGDDELRVGQACGFSDSICARYTSASDFQIMATVIISFALPVVVLAAFSSPPTTGRLGLVLGIMLAVFSLFQMVAFSFMASAVSEFEDANVQAGPTLGVAVIAWLFGVAGTFTILFLRSLATSKQVGPFQKCMSDRGGTAGRFCGIQRRDDVTASTP